MTRDIALGIKSGPRTWHALARATFELALARRKLGAATASEMLPSAREGEACLSPPALDGRQQRLVELVAFAVPRIAARAPWRADCLVQALAARRWLERAGVATELCIGVRKETGFEAHAWLKVGDAVVTGGDIGGFVPLAPARRLSGNCPA